MTCILAIDPGKSGALAWVTPDGHLIEVDDMPVGQIRDKTRIIGAELGLMMQRRAVDYVLIEQVGSMPRDGVNGAFWFGYGAGMLEGVATALGLSVRFVTPQRWKKAAGVPADKNGARVIASRIWPGAAERFRRVKDDGRAEAALMGRWAAMGGVK
jgi:crossover junction endodeoxyribonuclease RuvC